MNLRSFRLKLALLSALVSGGLLLVAGVVLWQITYRFELARVDRELRNLGTPHLERVLGGDHWVRFEGALRFVAGTAAAPAFILWVQNEDQVVHRSAHWPDAIDPQSFPPLTAYEPPGGPGPGQRRPPPPRRGEEISPRNPALPRKVPQFHTREAGGKTWRIGIMGNPYATVILGTNLDEFNAGMRDLRRTCLLGLPVALLFAGLGAWFLASRALRPVTVLTETAERVTARGLDQRLPAMTRDREFNRLITVFNEMLDRLEKSFHQANRFSADASHELKTPLTVLQGELEQALQAAEPGSEQERTCGRLLDEIGHLRAIVDKLLLLSQADAGHLPVRRERVDLSGALADLIEDVRALGPGLAVESDLEPGVTVEADADLLQRVLQNLAANAVKFNRDSGRVRLELRREGEAAVVRIANTGATIAPADQERIFERFYRTAAARDRQVGGVGLGLSLAREIVRAHGGDITLGPARDGLTEFVVRLPAQRG